MALKTKILVLVLLFGLQSILQFLGGFSLLSDGASYGEYGQSFANAGVMGFVAYVIYTKRNKWTYWIAMFFIGLTLVRIVLGAGLIVLSGIAPSGGQTALIGFVVVFFGIVPVFILLDKEVRAEYLSGK